MVPKPLSQLLLLIVTKEKNPKVRRLRDIANFMEMMVMWSLNVLKIWKP
jgi:hypothetical protein